MIAEFIAACLNRKQYNQDDICKKAFNVLDINQDGKISAEELERVFSLASGPNEIQVDRIEGRPHHFEVHDALREADADGDGEISFQEFVNLMKRGNNYKNCFFVGSVCFCHCFC